MSEPNIQNHDIEKDERSMNYLSPTKKTLINELDEKNPEDQEIDIKITKL